MRAKAYSSVLQENGIDWEYDEMDCLSVYFYGMKSIEVHGKQAWSTLIFLAQECA